MSTRERRAQAANALDAALVLAADRKRDGRTLVGDHEVDRLADLILRAGGK